MQSRPCIINRMNAILIHQPNSLSLVDLPIPQPGDNEVLIKVMASGICGTDIHIFHGEFLGGYPITPGHEFAGVIEQTGANVTRYKVGDRVAVEPNIACNNCVNCLNNRQNFCLNWTAIGVTRPGGMAQYVLAPENAVFSIGDLPFEQGAFVEPLSCVLHGSERARLRMGDRVLILGAGPIGLLLLQVARIQGAAFITSVERQPARAMIASQFGAERVYTDLDMLQPASYDVVIDATGVIPLMNRAIDFVRPGGTVLLFGVPPAGKNLEMEAFKIFHNGLTVLSSFTSVRNSYQAVALLSSGQVDVARLVSHRLPLGEFQHGMELIEHGRENVMKVIMVPNS
jgi:D-arabinitol dehydrogenase (NADP+)